MQCADCRGANGCITSKTHCRIACTCSEPNRCIACARGKGSSSCEDVTT